jgi:hypothetical protein
MENTTRRSRIQAWGGSSELRIYASGHDMLMWKRALADFLPEACWDTGHAEQNHLGSVVRCRCSTFEAPAGVVRRSERACRR